MQTRQTTLGVEESTTKPPVTGITFPDPANISSICSLKCCFDTAYIPPRAPSNWQFQAASACPNLMASRICPAEATEKPAYPFGATFDRSPAVHQSPEPAESLRLSIGIAFDSSHAPNLFPGCLQRYRRPASPRVSITRRGLVHGIHLWKVPQSFMGVLHDMCDFPCLAEEDRVAYAGWLECNDSSTIRCGFRK